ncbi:MAG: Pregnancy-associated plasma protein-A [Bacteroidota bacterium]|jgi:hypothetical protein
MTNIIFTKITMFGQSSCNTEFDAATEAMFNNLNLGANCSDDVSNLSNLPITFNLVIGYSTLDPRVTNTFLNNLIAKTNQIYNDKSIFFNTVLLPLEREDYLLTPSFFNANGKCILGWIGGEARGNIGEGSFIAINSEDIFIHELGHALGLLHTFQPNVNDGINPLWLTDERVTRDEDEVSCPCNCLEEGDKICDTPPDPNPTNANGDSQAGIWWNAIFGLNAPFCGFAENHGKKDICGLEYTDDSQVGNIMGYMTYNNCISMTNGQASMILKVLQKDGGGFKFTTPNFSLPVIQTGTTITTPTIWNSNKFISGNIIVESTLEITNAHLQFLGNFKIKVKPGGTLKIVNSKLTGFEDSGEFCLLTGAEKFGGIEVIGGAAISKVIILTNSLIDSEKGIYSTPGNTQIAVGGTTIKSDNELHFNGSLQSVVFVNSTIEKNIYFENCKLAALRGCTLKQSNSALQAIKSKNSKLELNGPGTIEGGKISVDFDSEGSHDLLIDNKLVLNPTDLIEPALKVRKANMVLIDDITINNNGISLTNIALARVKKSTLNLALSPSGQIAFNVSNVLIMMYTTTL